MLVGKILVDATRQETGEFQLLQFHSREYFSVKALEYVMVCRLTYRGLQFTRSHPGAVPLEAFVAAYSEATTSSIILCHFHYVLQKHTIIMRITPLQQNMQVFACYRYVSFL